MSFSVSFHFEGNIGFHRAQLCDPDKADSQSVELFGEPAQLTFLERAAKLSLPTIALNLDGSRKPTFRVRSPYVINANVIAALIPD